MNLSSLPELIMLCKTFYSDQIQNWTYWQTRMFLDSLSNLNTTLFFVVKLFFYIWCFTKHTFLNSMSFFILCFWNRAIHRPVVPGCAGCAMAHPNFGRSVNPISTRADRLCPPNYYWHTRIFRPSDGPALSYVVPVKSKVKISQNFVAFSGPSEGLKIRVCQ